MEIKFIGSGSSGNCCLVSDGSTRILLDAGLPLPEIQRGCNYETASIMGAFITHSHGDHIKGAAALAQMGIDIYSNCETLDSLGISSRRLHPLTELEPRNIRTWCVIPFDVHHDVRNYGYLIESRTTHERLVYMTDTYYTDYRFPHVTHWLIECNYIRSILNANRSAGTVPDAVYKRVLASHMSLDATLDLFKANDLRRTQAIYLIHLSDTNSDEAAMIKAVQEATGKPVYAAPRRR